MNPWVAVVQISLVFTMVMMAVLGAVAYTRKQVAGATGFILMCVGAFLYAGIYLLELRAVSLDEKFFFFRLKYIGVMILVGSLPAFALTFRNIFQKLGQAPNYFMGIFPAISFLFIITSSKHTFFINNLHLQAVGPFTVLAFDPAPWYTITLIYSLLMVMLAVILIFIQALSTSGIFRYQMNYLIIGILIPWLVGLFASLGWLPVKSLDITPISFSLSMPFLAIGVFRHRILSIIPVARGVIFERMTDGVLVLDNWNRIVDFNKPIQRLLKLRPLAKMIGKNAQDTINDHPQILAYLNSGQFDPQDIQIAGSVYEVRRHLLQDQRNIVVGQFIQFRDITAHYEMESAVQRSEAQYRSIWEQASDGILILQDMIIKLVNPEFGRIVGLKPEALVEKPVINFLPNEEKEYYLSHVYEWHNEELFPERFESRMLRADGSTRNIDVKASRITFNDQPAMLLFVRDITERKENEQRLVASEERYRITSELITDFAYATKVMPDTSLVGEWVTSAYSRIAQQPIEQLDAFSNLTSLTEAEDYPLVQNHVKRLLDGLADVCEFRIRDKNGDLRWIRNYCRPILDEKGGRVVRLVGAAQDLTERKMMEDDLREAKQWAQQEAITRSEFLLAMSQEIHAPLNAVKGMTGLLQNTELTDEQLDYLDTIRINADALHSLFNDILDYSKVEAGTITLELQPFSLRDCVEEALTVTAPMLADKPVYLGYVIEPGAPDYPIMDPHRVRQIIENLVSNAIKNTDEGEIILRVSARKVEYGNYEITFALKDTGVGIQPELIEKVFRSIVDPTASSPRVKRSAGLGLSLTSKLCAMMGGDLRATSSGVSGEGSTFIARILVANSAVLWKPEYIQAARSLQGKRLLMIGACSGAQQVHAAMLEPFGVTMEVACDLEQARSAIQQAKVFDLILIGQKTGEDDPVSVGKRIKEIKSVEKTPQLLICWQHIETSDPPGFAGYLPCPVTYETLLVSLTSVLSGTSLPRRLRRVPTEALGEDFALHHPHNILLADENKTSRNICTRILGKLGYNVTAVKDGNAVLNELEKHSYDIVVMDIHITDLDAMTATITIRNRWTDIPSLRIYGMSDFSYQEDVYQCLAVGMDGFLIKPFRMKQLRKLLE